MDTYRSKLIVDLFVTLPSGAAAATIRTAEELTTLQLAPVRRGYPMRAGDDPAFARFVLTEIFRKGYATHGADGSPIAIPVARAASRFSRSAPGRH